MKTTMKYMLIAAVALTSITACREQFEEVDNLHFDVTAETVVCKVGQPVNFLFEGSADIITFYSGEEGNDYAYKNQDRISPTRMGYSFSSVTKSGVGAKPNPEKVPFSYSTDFSGEYTEEAVRAATWIDISDRFKFASNHITQAQVFSELVDITDLFTEEETPVYFNYYCYCQGMETNPSCRSQWLIYSPTFYGITDAKSVELYDIVDAGWKAVLNETSYANDASYAKGINFVNTSRLMFSSDYKPVGDREMWFVSGPIYKMDNVNYGPDFGKAIKGVGNAMLPNYTYTYNAPGEYKVAFVAANANVYDRKECVVELTVKIVEDEGAITPPQPDEWN